MRWSVSSPVSTTVIAKKPPRATISDDIELVSTKNLLCLRGDFGKL
jgi:hypothetical protein